MTSLDNTVVDTFPDLELLDLQTAATINSKDAFQGKTTIVDFWTTKCTRCPDALDKLNDMAKTNTYKNINIVSICCDSCDGARNIIEKDDKLRWNHITHYYCSPNDKEKAKTVLGFKQVPFYVVLNSDGTTIQQMGSSKKVDLTNVPDMIIEKEETKDELVTKTTKQPEDDSSPIRKVKSVTAPTSSSSPTSVTVPREFIIDDDF